MKGYATVLVDPDHLELLTAKYRACKRLLKDFEAAKFVTSTPVLTWTGRTKYLVKSDMAGAKAYVKASGLDYFYFVRTSCWDDDKVPVLDNYDCTNHILALIELCKASRGGMIQIDQDLAATFNYLFPEGQ
jgi:hypothetical protein